MVTARKPLYKVLYVQVLVAIVPGAFIGWVWPDFAKNDWIKAIGDGFVNLIKMVIAPIIYCTVVSGIAHIYEAHKVGRVAVKALIYFEIISTSRSCSASSSATSCSPAMAFPACRRTLARSRPTPSRPAK